MYPGELERAERDLIRARRGLPRESAEPLAHRVGVALSGGGIRSATFSLGFFQALARAKLLRHVDLLSTVSGGGYFGGFFAGLFTRTGIANSVEEVEAILSGEQQPDVLDYLRENGRYLAPGGSDDLLLAGAVLLRSWVAVQLVLWTFALLGFPADSPGRRVLPRAGRPRQRRMGAGVLAAVAQSVRVDRRDRADRRCDSARRRVLDDRSVRNAAAASTIGPRLNALIATLLPLSVVTLRVAISVAGKASASSLVLSGTLTMLSLIFAAALCSDVDLAARVGAAVCGRGARLVRRAVVAGRLARQRHAQWTPGLVVDAVALPSA